ncbi:MAG TPA: methyl-accepting chemotaxis protein, partial [Burkholderiaceae bacterium]|nr:methyl-accepting chemotaxis protein [Burkholderiaceae bacterium]
YVVSGVLILALLGVALTGWNQLSHVAHLTESIEAQRVPMLQRISDIELNVTRTSLQLRHAILARSPEELAETFADIGAKRQLLDDTVKAYGQGLTSTEGKENFARMLPIVQDFWVIGGKNIELIKEGKKLEAFTYLVDVTIPARNRWLAILADERKRQGQELKNELLTVDKQALSTRNQFVALVGVVAAGLTVFAFYITNALRRRVAETQQVAERVRDGNLTVPVNDDGRDEFSPLLKAMSDMQDSLKRIVSNVRESVDSMGTATGQIAAGNRDLSGRTEQQASALQQTAASMEQLTGTVNHSADNAKQANELAASASEAAAKGGQVVDQVVASMEEISASSKKISDIIGVIDGIAFQTNILALNAAVEAARAGEQGRGFAVVAGEVRNLAQRSAQAAREIKSLISASVERVAVGSHQVAEAGATMHEIVSQVKRVSDLIGDITTATLEQSSGIRQVNEAMAQMDQVTQQNAALVEESAAAASLNDQAHQLAQVVSVFQVGQAQAHNAIERARISSAPHAHSVGISAQAS